MRGPLLALLLVASGLGVTHGGSATDNALRYFKAFKQLPAPDFSGFHPDQQCVRRNEPSGLNVISDVCWDGNEFFARCPGQKSPTHYELDDFFNFRTQLLPEAEFSLRVANVSINMREGAAFLMTSHLWPHNVQHVWPALNAVALGLPLRYIGVVGPLHYGLHGAQHPYSVQLMRALADHLNLIFIPSPDLDHGHQFWASFNRASPLCFDQVVIPNKGPSPRFGICTGAFMGPQVVQKHKVPFLEWLYGQARARFAQKHGETAASGFLPKFPRKPPKRVLILNRQQNRVLLNVGDVEAMLKELQLPYDVIAAEDMSLDEQLLNLAQAGILISPHGANLVNGLLMAPRSVVVEVFLRPEYYKCEWCEYLQNSGVKCLLYCPAPKGQDCPPSAPNQPYPRTNGTVDVAQLRRMVKVAMHLVR